MPLRIRIRTTLFYIKFLKLQTLAVSYLSIICLSKESILLYDFTLFTHSNHVFSSQGMVTYGTIDHLIIFIGIKIYFVTPASEFVTMKTPPVNHLH